MLETPESSAPDPELDGLDAELAALDAESVDLSNPAPSLLPAARTAIVERTLAEYLGTAPPADTATPMRPRRGWLLGPALGIAAGLTIVFLGRGREADLGPAEVDVLSAVRSEARTVEKVSPGGPFFLRCRVPGASVEIVSIRATRVATPHEEQPRTLGFTIDATTADGATLHVVADLPLGAWSLTCGVRNASGRFEWLAPPQALLIE